jgi:hypothetical protein
MLKLKRKGPSRENRMYSVKELKYVMENPDLSPQKIAYELGACDQELEVPD